MDSICKWSPIKRKREIMWVEQLIVFFLFSWHKHCVKYFSFSYVNIIIVLLYIDTKKKRIIFAMEKRTSFTAYISLFFLSYLNLVFLCFMQSNLILNAFTYIGYKNWFHIKYAFTMRSSETHSSTTQKMININIAMHQ